MTRPIANEWNENAGSHTKIAYAGLELKDLVATELNPYFQIDFNDSLADLEDYLGNQSILTIPEIVLLEVDENGDCFFIGRAVKKELYVQWDDHRAYLTFQRQGFKTNRYALKSA